MTVTRANWFRLHDCSNTHALTREIVQRTIYTIFLQNDNWKNVFFIIDQRFKIWNVLTMTKYTGLRQRECETYNTKYVLLFPVSAILNSKTKL